MTWRDVAATMAEHWGHLVRLTTPPSRRAAPEPAPSEQSEPSSNLLSGVRMVNEIACDIQAGRGVDPIKVRRANRLLASGNPLADLLADREGRR